MQIQFPSPLWYSPSMMASLRSTNCSFSPCSIDCILVAMILLLFMCYVFWGVLTTPYKAQTKHLYIWYVLLLISHGNCVMRGKTMQWTKLIGKKEYKTWKEFTDDMNDAEGLAFVQKYRGDQE